MAWIHHTVPEADVSQTKADIKSMSNNIARAKTDRTVTTKPTIAYGNAATLNQFPFMVSLQYVACALSILTNTIFFTLARRLALFSTSPIYEINLVPISLYAEHMEAPHQVISAVQLSSLKT